MVEIIREEPDIIITATSSPRSIISRSCLRSAKLLIAVGSSRADCTEIDRDIVAMADRYVDAKISIEGKGEYAIPLRSGQIDPTSIVELHDILMNGASYVFGKAPTAIFVSKGLVIEDYALAMAVLKNMGA